MTSTLPLFMFYSSFSSYWLCMDSLFPRVGKLGALAVPPNPHSIRVSLTHMDLGLVVTSPGSYTTAASVRLGHTFALIFELMLSTLSSEIGVTLPMTMPFFFFFEILKSNLLNHRDAPMNLVASNFVCNALPSIFNSEHSYCF